MFFVYFLQSEVNNKFYVGITEKEPQIRCQEHNNGTTRWTRQNGPFRLIYFEEYFCKTDAIRRENFYKMGFGKRIRNAIIREVTK